jgi:hypothetical protein
LPKNVFVIWRFIFYSLFFLKLKLKLKNPIILGTLRPSGGSTNIKIGENDGSKLLSVGTIAGIVIAGIIVVVLLTTLLFVFKRVQIKKDRTLLSFDNAVYCYDTMPGNEEPGSYGAVANVKCTD